ncbi:Gfo/Idh/MocA family protein [Roseibacillus ishigakijimensis]|uniref:Gfo/Idh/MocA family oxidoreductase n=1 Tax=Roseibacillus ishigakijimensis TaxID=454146 RepID=A0A934RRY6_9BACT|nr:Gfo/Idh/MocA family oxidoreductase [Roseibacillus ishigakijimensis]MBK1834551.1 Gfo/Idh/MocA family oxidoreductase [Roseibacillus ishigakijimensis]
MNSKIRVACIGVGGKGRSDTENAARCGGEIVALCDVDGGMMAPMAAKFPQAAKFADWRQLYEQMGEGFDAVTISGPDHMHGPAGIAAMQMKKHVFCQKPLTQTVWESRMMRNLVKSSGVATQMGNQGSAADGLRRSVELIQAGVIGKPTELHVWTNRPVWPQGLARPGGSDPIPENLNWDCWLGPAQERPFKKDLYHAFKWRGWTDFGTGALGDMACHTVNMPFRALKLGYPTKIECEMSSRVYAETYPLTSRVRFEFPEREGLPPLKFWWYEGTPGGSIDPIRPYPELVNEIVTLRGGQMPISGALIVGEKGKLFSQDDYGREFYVMMNDEKGYTQGDQHPACQGIEETIPRSPGHEEEWFAAMQGGPAAYSNFEIAAYLNEVILLGCIAQQVGEGHPIEWDGPNMRSHNNETATALVKRDYREGWAPQI